MKPLKQRRSQLLIIGSITSVLLPWLFPNFIGLLTFLWVMIILALSWDIMGGQLGYNSFGNIFFFGLGMYCCAVIQSALSGWLPALGQWEYFFNLVIGIASAGLLTTMAAAILGLFMLNLRGHYFAICTLGLGIAAGEIASGIELIGGGSGMVPPLYPREFVLREIFFYYLLCGLGISTIGILHRLYRARFGLIINAIRDDEDKAEAMGLHTSAYKTLAWCFSAFFLGLVGALVGNIIGFIDPIDTAFAGSTFGVWMILMAILGGKGTLWGPVIGAAIFYLSKEVFWTYFLDWNRVILGLLIILIVVFFPEGIMGWWNKRHKIKDTVNHAK